jgi:hypothetical protein
MHSSRHERDQWLRRAAETLIRPDKKSLLRRAKQEQDAIIERIGHCAVDQAASAQRRDWRPAQNAQIANPCTSAAAT